MRACPGALLLHVPAGASFGEIAPYLEAAVALHRRAGLPGAVGVSIREIETVRGGARAIPIGEDGAMSSARLAPELIQRVVRASFGGLRKCYEDALAKDSSAEGKTVTRFVIGREGRVVEASTSLDGNLPPEVAACMQAIFKGLVFAPPGGGNVTVNYPIVLRPDMSSGGPSEGAPKPGKPAP